MNRGIRTVGGSCGALVAAAVLALTTGCSSDASAPPPGSAADPSFATQQPVSPQPAGTNSPEPTGTARSTGTTPATAPKASTPPPIPAIYCRTSELDVTVGQGDAGLSHVAKPLVFRNRSSRSCVLYGYPGVAGLDSAGHQVTQAKRSPTGYFSGGRSSSTPQKITVPPGGTASAGIEGTVIPASGSGNCPPIPRMLVTPPNETHSIVVDNATPGCSNLLVHPVVAGAKG